MGRTIRPGPSERIVADGVADGEANWWASEEGVAQLQRIEAEVRARYGDRLAQPGWLEKRWLEWRIQREIAAERARAALEILWLGR